MVIISYKKSHHKQIIHACVLALKQGKIMAYPTDTSYGLAVDAGNISAIKKLYKIKGRNFKKPIHIITPSVAYAKKIARWNNAALKLAKKFWPGPLTVVLKLKVESRKLKVLSAGAGFIGIRMPKNKIALDLVKYLGRPITTTSANLSGKRDCYSSNDIVAQFKNKKSKPDIIINAGKLPKRQPSTVVKIENNNFYILREGSITKKQINQIV